MCQGKRTGTLSYHWAMLHFANWVLMSMQAQERELFSLSQKKKDNPKVVALLLRRHSHNNFFKNHLVRPEGNPSKSPQVFGATRLTRCELHLLVGDLLWQGPGPAT